MTGETEGRAPVWLWPNLLSLDAPLVAMLWQWTFARASGVALPVMAHVLLGVAVWVVYAGDRLLDAARLDESRPATARHRFYRRHWKIFLAGVIAAGGFGAMKALYSIPEALAVRGIFLAMLVASYFLYLARARRSRRIVIPKEILCGVLFALGTNLSTEFYKSTSAAEGSGVLQRFVFEGALALEGAGSPRALIYMALCSMNCAVIAVWERNADEAQDAAAWTQFRPSFEVSFSVSFLLLTAVSLGLAVMSRGSSVALVYGCMAASALALRALESRATRFSPSALRALADVALLTPLPVAVFL